jgi:hypothetical protein
MQKKATGPRHAQAPAKRFAGRAPLAELAAGADPEQTIRFSLKDLSEAAACEALEGGLDGAKARDVLAALPKKG